MSYNGRIFITAFGQPLDISVGGGDLYWRKKIATELDLGIEGFKKAKWLRGTRQLGFRGEPSKKSPLLSCTHQLPLVFAFLPCFTRWLRTIERPLFWGFSKRRFQFIRRKEHKRQANDIYKERSYNLQERYIRKEVPIYQTVVLKRGRQNWLGPRSRA